MELGIVKHDVNSSGFVEPRRGTQCGVRVRMVRFPLESQLPCVQYIPRNMHAVFALLCFVVVIHWLIFPYPSGLLHWHCGNLTIAPVPAKQPWWIWINTSCEFIMNDYKTTTKQSTTKPCAYFLGYTVPYPLMWETYGNINVTGFNSTCWMSPFNLIHSVFFDDIKIQNLPDQMDDDKMVDETNALGHSLAVTECGNHSPWGYTKPIITLSFILISSLAYTSSYQLHIAKLSGCILSPASLNLSDCMCPEECNTYSYSLQQSSASLALLGVRQLLDSITPDVGQSYYRALDMDDRMEPNNFYTTLNSLENIMTNIEGKECPHASSTIPMIFGALRQYLSSTIFEKGVSEYEMQVLL